MKKALTVILILICAAFAGLGAVGYSLTAPKNGSPLHQSPPGYKRFVIQNALGDSVVGWRSLTSAPRTMVLLHGIGRGKDSMLSRSELLVRNGFNTILIDHQGHGESGGSRITAGYRESKDVVAAFRYARAHFGGLPTGALGISMGGAAALLAIDSIQPSWLVLEMVYPSIAEAIRNRIVERLGPMAGSASPLLTWQMPLQLGVSADSMVPLQKAPAVRCPTILVVGDADPRTTLPESQRLFAAFAAPKEMVIIAGARHENLYAKDAATYASRVIAFLEAHPPVPALAAATR